MSQTKHILRPKLTPKHKQNARTRIYSSKRKTTLILYQPSQNNHIRDTSKSLVANSVPTTNATENRTNLENYPDCQNGFYFLDGCEDDWSVLKSTLLIKAKILQPSRENLDNNATFI